MPGLCRLGDKAKAEEDDHGCPSCPHTVIGPAVVGSSTVMINNKPALRLGDEGVHGSCCGSNKWRAVGGNDAILIDGQPAVCVGDLTEHCGAMGAMVEGSPDITADD